MGSPSMLVVILSSIFAFILLVFSGMLLCFTWRTRKGRRRVIAANCSSNSRGNAAKYPTSIAREREERWSQRGKAANDLSKSEDNNDDAMLQVNIASANEWGATVNEDRTRSYLRGWFGLDRPLPVNSLTSSRGQHHRLEQGIEMDREDEWEAKSVVSSDEATLHDQPAAAGAIDAEKQEHPPK